MAAAIASASDNAYSPNTIQNAYAVSSSQLTGSGQTIAIVDAYDDPTIAQDLQAFDKAYGLPAANLAKVEMTSGGQLPGTNSTWAAEVALDVEWAHAVAPGASILLVEAYDSSVPDLMSAVDYARNAPGVSVVSMSWGVSEFAGEAAYDSYFTTPADHAPVAFVAAAGDSGSTGGAAWPAVADQVLGVGGTTLNVAPGGAYGSETMWSGSSSGTSTQVSEPPYQMGVQSTGMRTTPDVSWDANPATGFSVYNSFDTSSPWQDLGGTSAGAPQWAGLIAMADQGRALLGEAAIGDAPAAIYGLPSSDFHNVSTSPAGGSSNTGTSGAATTFTATASTYSPEAGLGTPVASQVVADLVNSPVTFDNVVVSGAANVAAVAGTVDGPVSGPWNPPPQTSGRGPSTPAGSGPGSAQPYSVILYGTPAGSAPTAPASQPTVAVTLPSESAGASGLTAAQVASSSLAAPSSAPGSLAPSGPSANALGANLGNNLRPLEHDGDGLDGGNAQGGSGLLASDLATQSAGENGWAGVGRGGQQARSIAMGPRSQAGHAEPVPEDDRDSLAAIDNLFASGQWMDQILAAHPTATLPASFASDAEGQLDAADQLGQLAADAAAAAEPVGSWTVSRGWIAAALALGAFWQMRRSAQADPKPVAAGGAPHPSTLSRRLGRVASLWKSSSVRVK